MLAIYRKYRPKTWSDLLGQEIISEILRNASRLDKLAHAYLFYGPKGSGKTTTARIIAKIANCEKRQNNQEFKKLGEPCNECQSCMEIDKGIAMDVMEIDAASNRGIDEIRNLKENIRVSPSSCPYKVYIIDECLTGDHLISLADGGIKKISDIKNGELINSIDIATGKIVKKPLTNWFKKKCDEIIKIRTPQTILKITPSHRLWVMRNGEFLLLEGRNIKTGDFLLSPIYLPHYSKNKLTPDKLTFLALIQCDGHISKNSITVQIEISKDRDYFQKIFQKGIKAWGIKEKPVIKITSRKTKLIRIYSKKLKDILIKMNCPSGKKSNLIDISDSIFHAPLKSIKAYIDACFCCKGGVSQFNCSNNINYKLNFSSTSKIFVRKLQLLLKKFGIGSNILEIKRKNKNHADVFRLSLSGYNLRLFAQKIKLTLKRKNSILKKHLQKKEKQDCIPIEKIILAKRKEKNIIYSQLIQQGIFPALGKRLTRKSVENFIKIGNLPELNHFLKYRYEKVKKIEIIKNKEWVYDFTVEGTHTFIADGICSSNCHQLTKDAFNALLKTLEEPPSHAILILVTTESEKMPVTIISRTQRFHFKKAPLKIIIEKLRNIAKIENIKITDEAIELISEAAGGSFRDGESLLDQISSLTPANTNKNSKNNIINASDVEEIIGSVSFQKTSKLAELLIMNDLSGGLNYLSKINEDGYNLIQFNKDLIHYFRRVLALKFSLELKNHFSRELTDQELKIIEKHSQMINTEKTIKLIKLLIEAYTEMRYSPFIIAPLEVAIIESLK